MSPHHQRLVSVDALRGVAVILMVQQHLGSWLLDFRGNYGNLDVAWIALNATGGAAAPLFITLAGVGVALSEDRDLTDRRLLLRGASLVGFGVLLNLLTPAWFTIFSFYVLHLLGCFLLLAPLSRRLSNGALLAAAAGSLLIGAGGQAWLETPIRLEGPELSSIERGGGMFRLAAFEGHFPLFPWLALALGGQWAGRMLKRDRLMPLLIVGAYCGGLAGALRLLTAGNPEFLNELPFRPVFRFTFYPATTTFVLALFAVCIGLILSFLWLEKQRAITERSWLIPLGQTSLSLLFVHIVVFREWAERLDFRRILDPWPTLAVITMVVIIWAVLARFWRHSEYRFGLEWLLRSVGRLDRR